MFNNIIPEIPLLKYGKERFPLTSKSTLSFWAKQGYIDNKGPLRGIVRKINGRWYVNLSKEKEHEDIVVNNIFNEMKQLSNS